MAKYTARLNGEFYSFCRFIQDYILNSSVSATLEETNTTVVNDVQCCVLAFERYSVMGSNRVSLNITVLGFEEQIYAAGIAAGGSQAMFFKVNTFGEEAFLDVFREAVQAFRKSKGSTRWEE